MGTLKAKLDTLGEALGVGVVVGVLEGQGVGEVILLGSSEGALDEEVVEEDQCDGESEGAVLAVGCTEAVSEMLAVAVGVGLRDVLALPESSQHEELLLAPASE